MSKPKISQEEVLRAVIVADSFNSRFRPLTFTSPRCLLPIANVPAIEYSLEFLTLNGVQEIIVICCAHSEAIKAYLGASRYKVTVIVSKELTSMGDVLRELDAKQILDSDFILMSGDTVAKFDISLALKEHKERREKDKNAIMTMVLRQASNHHPTKARGEEELFVIDKLNECVQYQSFELYPRKKRVGIPLETFEKHSQLEVRSDLIDPQIDICSVSVLALFTENFDYQSLRKDFVRGILESDLLGQSIHVHILKDGYSAKASSFQMFDAISRDVLSRWSFPLVPDNHIFGTNITHRIPHLYLDQDVVISSSAKLKERVAVGSGTKIGDLTTISNSVIGKNVVIGDNVVIEGSYVFDNVIVKSGSKLVKSVLGTCSQVGSNTHLAPGCVLGESVIVGPSIELPRGTKVCLPKWTNIDSKTGIALGSDSNGVVYIEPEDEHDEFDIRNIKMGLLDYDRVGDLPEFENESGLDTDAESEEISDDDDEENDWRQEVSATLDRAFNENHTIDTAGLELNTLKMAYAIEFTDLQDIVVPKLMSRVDLKNASASVNLIFKYWTPLLVKFTHDPIEQVHILDLVTNACVAKPEYSKILLLLLRVFYELDLIDEDAILNWHLKLPESKVKSTALPFVNWLKQADEEEVDDDE